MRVQAGDAAANEAVAAALPGWSEAELDRPGVTAARQLQAMNAVASVLAGSLSLDEVLGHAVSSLLEVTGLNSGVVYFLSEDENRLIGRNYVGFRHGFEDKIQVHSLRSRSLPSRAFRSSRPELFDRDDPSCDMTSITAAERRAIEPEDIRSAVACRLESSSKVHGVLVLSSHGARRTFSASELSFVWTVCSQIGVAIERAGLYEDLTRRMSEATTLYEMGRILGSDLESDQVLPSVLELACQRFGFLRCEVELVEPIGAIAVFADSPSPPIHPARASVLTLPLDVATAHLGTLRAFHIGRPTDRERRRLRPMADLLAMAVWNRRLYEESRRLGITEERNRLAREIHDGLTQTFFSIQLQLQAAERSLASLPPEAAEQVRDAAQLARQGLDETRQSVRNLRSPGQTAQSLAEAISGLARLFRRESHIACRVAVDGTERPMAPGKEGAIFRGVQELLHNVHKHAEASEVLVTLTFGAEMLTVTIQDDGVGFDEVRHDRSQRLEDKRMGYSGWGLIGIRERMAAVGGTFDISSRAGNGTTARLEVGIGQHGASDTERSGDRV